MLIILPSVEVDPLIVSASPDHRFIVPGKGWPGTHGTRVLSDTRHAYMIPHHRHVIDSSFVQGIIVPGRTHHYTLIISHSSYTGPAIKKQLSLKNPSPTLP